MASGYTAPVADGKVDDLKTFALTCARAFLVQCRDISSDEPIPRMVPSKYYKDALAEAKLELARVEKISPHEAKRLMVASAREDERCAKDYKRRRLAVIRRYESLLSKVQGWSPPTLSHAGLKKFMVDQLTQSIVHERPLPYYNSPAPSSPTEYVAKHVLKAAENVRYFEKEVREDEERCRESNAWVDDLKTSLEPHVRRPRRSA